MLPTMVIIRDTITLPREFLKCPKLANDFITSVIRLHHRSLLEIVYIVIVTRYRWQCNINIR